MYRYIAMFILACSLLFCPLWSKAQICVGGDCVSYPDLVRTTRGIIWILRTEGARLSDYRLKFAESFAWAIVPPAKKYGVDLDAMVVTAYAESSFYPEAIGKKGEFGLYQIHPDKAKRMKRWISVRENADYGARLLARATKRCREKFGDEVTWEHVFGHYRSGYCNPEYGEKKARLVRNLKAALKEE